MRGCCGYDNILANLQACSGVGGGLVDQVVSFRRLCCGESFTVICSEGGWCCRVGGAVGRARPRPLVGWCLALVLVCK
jgi:hypothetical protein